MKICMITALDPSKTGIPKYTEGVANGFRRSNLPIKLFLLVNKDAKEPRWSSRTTRVVRCWEQKITYPFQITSRVLTIRPNVVHVQHEFFLFGGTIEAAIFPLFLFMMRLCGFPTVLTLHGVPVLDHITDDFANGFFMNQLTLSTRFFLRPFLSFICRLSSAVIVHAEFAKNVLVEYYSVDKKKVFVVPHGVDEFLYGGVAKEASKNGPTQVLFFGFITPTKGIEDLIEAFMLIPTQDLRLDIVGGRHRRDDHYFSNVLRLVTSDARISAVGYVSDRALPKYFGKSDFIVLPHRYQISSSGALAMAFAYEKPVIVTNTRYFSEAIKDGYNGLVVPVRDVRGLKSAIQLLAEDQATLQRLARGCKETKRKLAWSRLSLRFWSIYRNIAERKNLPEVPIERITRATSD